MALRDQIRKLSGDIQILYMVKKTMRSTTQIGQYGLIWPGVQYNRLPSGQWDRYLEFFSANKFPPKRMVRLKGTPIPKLVWKGSRYGARGRYRAYEGLTRLQEEASIYINGSLGKLELDLQTMLSNLSILERRYATEMQSLKMKKERELSRVKQEAELAASKAIQLSLEKELAIESNQAAVVLKKGKEMVEQQGKLNKATVMADRVSLELEVANQEEIQATQAANVIDKKTRVIDIPPVEREIKQIVRKTLIKPANTKRIVDDLDLIRATVMPQRVKFDLEAALRGKAKELPLAEERKVITGTIQAKAQGKAPKIGLPIAAAAGILVIFLNR